MCKGVQGCVNDMVRCLQNVPTSVILQPCNREGCMNHKSMHHVSASGT